MTITKQYYVLEHDSICKPGSSRKLYRSADGELCVWCVEDNAIKHCKLIGRGYQKFVVRVANSSDFAAVSSKRKNKFNLPIYKVMDEESMAKKTTSTGLLVEVFEDYESRRFAISSRAQSENEFITEVSQALANSQSTDWNTRLRETLPLIVDLCCKYRGYKAESVHERRELIAGDLEVPK